MTVFSHFEDLQDPRIERTKRYDLQSLVFLAIAATVADCDSFTQMADFAEERLEWFQGHGHFLGGDTPSHDTLSNLFRRLEPGKFQECFLRWAGAVCGDLGGRLVSIDGKTLRRSHDSSTGKGSIHVVNVWCDSNRMVLAQMKVDDKSNEITAIPELLAMIDIKGAVISIDAIGCQREIVNDILAGEADYLLGVKANQPKLLEQVEMLFVHHGPSSTDHTLDKGHGRIESRTCDIIDQPDLVGQVLGWKGLNTLVRVVATREEIPGGKKTEEVRFYISSARADARQFNAWARGHWGIENRVHWVLDATFREDASRVRKDHGDQNLSLIRKTALNICQLHNRDKKTLVRKRKSAARNSAYLDDLLGFKTR